MVKPTFTGRRSKEEREAMEKEAKERDRLRNLERAAADKRKQRDAENAAKREARNAAKARGGYSGAVSGPFSLGSSKEGQSKEFVSTNIANCYDRQEIESQSWYIKLRFRIRLPSRAGQKRGR
jgi:hypothetical protein